MSIAKKYVDDFNPLEDLVQDGLVGMLLAADRYDGTHNAKFSTYASHIIESEIDKAAKERRNLVNVSYVYEQNFRKAASSVNKENPDDSSINIGRIAANMNRKESTVIAIMNSLATPASYDDPAVRETIRDGTTGGWAEEYSFEEQEIEKIELGEKIKLLNRNMYLLTQRQRVTVKLVFGMEDGIQRTYEEVGYELNCNRQRIKQVLDEALKLLASTLSGTCTEEERILLNRILEDRRITQIEKF